MLKSQLFNIKYLPQKYTNWFWLGALLFVLANVLSLAFGFYMLNLLPVALILIALAFVSFEKTLLLILFFVPFSIRLKELFPTLNVDLYLPTEPLLFLLLLLSVSYILLEKFNFREILRHPVTLSILFYLFWMAVTSATSTLPLVSFKYLLVHLWFITAFYFISLSIFKNPDNFRRYFLIYATAMVLVIFYATGNLALHGLANQKAAHSAPNPFFNDHTSYGAIVAMCLPFLIGLATRKNFLLPLRIVFWLLVLLFTTALFFSYSRAAWLSVIVALLVFILIKLRIRFSVLLMSGVLLTMILLFFRGEIIMKLEKNRQDSSIKFTEQIRSISNISSDASNLERINRWESAFRMFREKPLLGWGPGTYMFQYAAFQSSRNKTIISTNFGDRGNAHSEYIGPLAESGVPGTLSVILLLTTVFYTGFSYYSRVKKSPFRWIALAASLSLVTYAVHGMMNNFLDTDKASALFWGFIAMIVALDLYYSDEKTDCSRANS